jgi:plastocyanin
MSQQHAVLAVIAVLAVLALLAPATAQAKTFYGRVGPGFTITLKRADGTIVRRVQHERHTFVIRDRSSMHNFHLFGPGVDRRTGVAFTGRRRWSIRLRAGTYRYRCDPHRTTMRGRFAVV